MIIPWKSDLFIWGRGLRRCALKSDYIPAHIRERMKTRRSSASGCKPRDIKRSSWGKVSVSTTSILDFGKAHSPPGNTIEIVPQKARKSANDCSCPELSTVVLPESTRLSGFI
ncbi:hypothetical protein BDP55DRAFT_672944 [Colletotrichum godetiae]|uniref:Uncharacterized protein n=1 Tax=Colletotrichum godetiae TaxID=1209918 RepID=A0AAJ0EQ41_9PEZI|nr:uncharacterized protein BDP55DRAFT_672944 [Colletotrichum godetiae]KAK1672366.1 hypothetical protein BDP55DRAFT_672944 [Colletotrichum godetiae]